MNAFPGSFGGRSDDVGAPEWLDDLSRQIDRFVDVSTGEAKSIAVGLRRTFSSERLEQALSTLRARLRRDGGVVPGVDAEKEFRAVIRRFGLESTIEEWTRHTVAPPSIKL